MHFSHFLAALPLAAALPQSKRSTIESRQAGATTRNDPRPQLGSVPYGGAGVRTCTVPGTVAITYDDGPNQFTGQLLDTLASYGFKATFFVSGDNGRGALDGDGRWIDLVKRMENEGHQIASHTWTHSNLDEIPIAQKFDEMVKTEMAIRNILQKYPTYMRPPYAACTGACSTVMGQLGYVIAQYDLETSDWAHQDNIQISKDIFKSEMDRTSKQNGRIVIAHDIHEQTVSSLTPFMLQYLKDNGWRGVTVGECLGDPKENWYRPSTGTTPGCPPEGCNVSNNGLCGSQGGATCAGSVFGNCCSRFGYCGSSNDYCGADNCNPTYGTCGTGSTPTTTTRPSPPTTTTTQNQGPTSTPQPGAPVSQNGLCGVQGGETCTGSVWGACCSQWGYCGDSDAYCVNCNSAFGAPCKS